MHLVGTSDSLFFSQGQRQHVDLVHNLLQYDEETWYILHIYF
jgi:hypothetical protein